MTESFDFITDNIESIKSGKLDDNKVESLCKLILIDYEKTIYDQSYIKYIYRYLISYVYIPQIQSYLLFILLRQSINLFKDQIKLEKDKDKYRKWYNELSRKIFKRISSDIREFNHINNIPEELPDQFTIDNLMNEDYFYNIIEKFAYCDDMKKEIEGWEE